MNFLPFRTVSSGLRTSVYFDHNATSPLAMLVAERVPSWLQLWGNPGSIHQLGRAPKALMRESRNEVAKMIGASPLEIIFTSGGSEGNNLIIKGVYESLHRPSISKVGEPIRNHYVFSDVEHPSVTRVAQDLRERGAEVDLIPVDRDGQLDLTRFASLVTERTALVSVMNANNETGTIFPIAAMVKLAHERGALFHSDCVQVLGKLPIDVRELGVDFATFSGHKFYSLKGVGFVYAKRGKNVESLIHGGGQERHRRAGTENLLAIASLGAMCQLRSEVAPRGVLVERLRDHMENRIVEEIGHVQITAKRSPRLPNSSSLVIEGVDGETLLMNLDLRGYCVSTGAACSSGSPEPSPVLLAMGLTRAQAQSSLRLGLGWETTQEEVEEFVEVLKQVVAHLRTFNSKNGPDHVDPTEPPAPLTPSSPVNSPVNSPSERDSHVRF